MRVSKVWGGREIFSIPDSRIATDEIKAALYEAGFTEVADHISQVSIGARSFLVFTDLRYGDDHVDCVNHPALVKAIELYQQKVFPQTEG